MTSNQPTVFSVSNLSKSYPSPDGKLDILKNISFEVAHASFTAIVGESGSGKSTLLQILGTLDSPDKGEIILDGTTLNGLSDKKLAKLRNQNIGFIYQSHHLIPELSALENVMLPLLISGESSQSAKQKALTLLTQFKLSERVEHIPAHLSGGEAQRVAVARALITNPKIILADEPTGNLDESTAHTVFNMIHDLCKSKGVAVIMVTHSKTFAAECDEVLVLSKCTLTQLQT